MQIYILVKKKNLVVFSFVKLWNLVVDSHVRGSTVIRIRQYVRSARKLLYENMAVSMVRCAALADPYVFNSTILSP